MTKKKTCPDCKGARKKMVMVGPGMGYDNETCPTCKGEGEVEEKENNGRQSEFGDKGVPPNAGAVKS